MDISDTKRFLLAGNATITVKSCASGVRYTWKVTRTKFDDNAYFVALLSGPDNTSDFQYLGMLYASVESGSWYTRLTGASRVDAQSQVWRAFKWFIAGVETCNLDHLSAADWWHEGTCGACGRKLTVPESIEMGLGPVCAGRV